MCACRFCFFPLFGKEPDIDIKIIYAGLCDEEKLYEELITGGEDILPTAHEKVMLLRSNNRLQGINNQREIREKLDKDINELMQFSESHDTNAIKKKLKEIVPEYTPQENDAVL